MTAETTPRDRIRAAKPISAAAHKFSVGLHVSYRGQSGVKLYRVTRHLPDGGQGLQYRIRSDDDGHERVVIESALERKI